MDEVIVELLKEYECKSVDDHENALREIMQEIALLGLWRAKFFEHALFYGGTALRILYGLPRFSEDLDFSLLNTQSDFDLRAYHQAIGDELESFGFEVEIVQKDKSVDSQVLSAFLKAETRKHLLKISVPESLVQRVQAKKTLKIKLELDTDPPGEHGIEVKDVFRPIPFQVKTMPMEDLFAGKIHAVLAREWKSRAKGRDFYDYLWYLGRGSRLHLAHLKARLVQSGHYAEDKQLSEKECKELLTKRFQSVDIEQAKQDVRPFLKAREAASLELWTNEYFVNTIETLFR